LKPSLVYSLLHPGRWRGAKASRQSVRCWATTYDREDGVSRGPDDRPRLAVYVVYEEDQDPDLARATTWTSSYSSGLSQLAGGPRCAPCGRLHQRSATAASVHFPRGQGGARPASTARPRVYIHHHGPWPWWQLASRGKKGQRQADSSRVRACPTRRRIRLRPWTSGTRPSSLTHSDRGVRRDANAVQYAARLRLRGR
jgi:hypothetical protein